MSGFSDLPPASTLATTDELMVAQAGTVSRVDLAKVKTKVLEDLVNVDNTADTAKPVSIAAQAALDLKADASSISSVDNTADTDKPVSTAQQLALGLKVNSTAIDQINNTSDLAKPLSTATTSALALKLDATAISEMDNTADVDKPVSNATTTALASKASNTALALKLDATAVTNVDNTSDANKPVSTAGQTALDLKADKTAISNVDNTSDMDKPVSTATQTAINAGVVPNLNDLTLTGFTTNKGAGDVSTNTAFGQTALEANSTGANVTAVGDTAANQNTEGSGNTAVGSESLTTNSVGNDSTAVGHQALANSTSNQNTAVGKGAAALTSTGGSQVAVGHKALNTNTDGIENVAVGDSASRLSTGSNSVAIGTKALENSTGDGNTAVGDRSGTEITVGFNNVTIGAGSQASTPNTSNEVTLGNEQTTKVRTMGTIVVEGFNDLTSKAYVDAQIISGGASGGASTNTLSDVDTVTNPPKEGESLVYTDGKFVPKSLKMSEASDADLVKGASNSWTITTGGSSGSGGGAIENFFPFTTPDIIDIKLNAAGIDAATDFSSYAGGEYIFTLNGLTQLVTMTDQGSGIVRVQVVSGADIQQHPWAEGSVTAFQALVAISDGDVWVYDTNDSKFHPAKLELDKLSDVDLTTNAATEGQVLVSRSGKFIPETPTVNANLDSLTDVDLTTAAATEGQVLINRTGNFVPETPTLDGLTDVDLTTAAATEGQILIKRGAAFVPELLPASTFVAGNMELASNAELLILSGAKWQGGNSNAQNSAGGAYGQNATPTQVRLNNVDLGGTTIDFTTWIGQDVLVILDSGTPFAETVTAVSGSGAYRLITFTTNGWFNTEGKHIEVVLSNAPRKSLETGDIWVYDFVSKTFKPQVLKLDSLSDVDLTTAAATDGQVLISRNGKFVPETAASTTFNIEDAGNVSLLKVLGMVWQSADNEGTAGGANVFNVYGAGTAEDPFTQSILVNGTTVNAEAIDLTIFTGSVHEVIINDGTPILMTVTHRPDLLSSLLMFGANGFVSEGDKIEIQPATIVYISLNDKESWVYDSASSSFLPKVLDLGDLPLMDLSTAASEGQILVSRSGKFKPENAPSVAFKMEDATNATLLVDINAGNNWGTGNENTTGGYSVWSGGIGNQEIKVNVNGNNGASNVASYTGGTYHFTAGGVSGGIVTANSLSADKITIVGGTEPIVNGGTFSLVPTSAPLLAPVAGDVWSYDTGENKFIPKAPTTTLGALTDVDFTTAATEGQILVSRSGKFKPESAPATHTHANTAILDATTKSYTDASFNKLAGIELLATADQTGAEIKAAYELETNTNAYTDADKTKLGTIESGATADQTGLEIKTAYELELDTNAYTDAEKAKVGLVPSSIGTEGQVLVNRSGVLVAEAVPEGHTHSNTTILDATTASYTTAEETKLGTIETSATADQTGLEIKTAYELELDTNAYTDAEKAKVVFIPASIGTEGQVLVNRSGVLVAEAVPSSHTHANTAVLDATTASYTTADVTKLGGIEALATADQTGLEIKTAYELELDTNAFTDIDKAKAALFPTAIGIEGDVLVHRSGVLVAEAPAAGGGGGGDLTVAGKTGGGLLVAGSQINELRDSGAYTLPLANSVAANSIIIVSLPDKFKASTPTLTRSGTDNIRNGDGIDTVINFLGAVEILLVSNGSSEWSL